MSKINFQMSRSDRPRLELTSRVGCGRRCDYCPQETYIKAYRGQVSGNTALTFDLIQNISRNIPSDTVISHTGFTEPFDCKDFPKIVNHFADRNMAQTISTTLYGFESNQTYFADNLEKFDHGITLHLPDNQKLMKGKFDGAYSEYLDHVLTNFLSLKERPNSLSLVIFLIGDEFHEAIRPIVKKYEPRLGIENIHRAAYLNTRAGLINVQKFNKKQSTFVRSTNQTFYCSYKRLNRGVLLPNGEVVVCSQDYGLKRVIGSLIQSDLNSIYSKIESDPELSAAFLEGRMTPCVDCEHYRTIDAQATTDRN